MSLSPANEPVKSFFRGSDMRTASCLIKWGWEIAAIPLYVEEVEKMGDRGKNLADH